MLPTRDAPGHTTWAHHLGIPPGHTTWAHHLGIPPGHTTWAYHLGTPPGHTTWAYHLPRHTTYMCTWTHAYAAVYLQGCMWGAPACAACV